jgi:hypothetical protein
MPEAPKPKLCINCKHHKLIATEDWCTVTSLVDREYRDYPVYWMRSSQGPCGYTGKLFEAK